MKSLSKLFAIGLALATAAGAGIAAVPAQAQGDYRLAAYHDGRDDRGWDRRDREYRGWDRRHERRHDGWNDRRGWRGDGRWRGRDRCWTDWRRNGYGRRVPVRICR
jgi:hypothetical protein